MKIEVYQGWKKKIPIYFIVIFSGIIWFTGVLLSLFFEEKLTGNDRGAYSGTIYLLVLIVQYLLFFFSLWKWITLARYVVVVEEGVVMYSFFGRKLGAVHWGKRVYYQTRTLIKYEILPSKMYNEELFIVMSNEFFEPYCKEKTIPLYKMCKVIDKNAHQVIMPYREDTRSLLPTKDWDCLGSENWYWFGDESS